MKKPFPSKNVCIFNSRSTVSFRGIMLYPFHMYTCGLISDHAQYTFHTLHHSIMIKACLKLHDIPSNVLVSWGILSYHKRHQQCTLDCVYSPLQPFAILLDHPNIVSNRRHGFSIISSHRNSGNKEHFSVKVVHWKI